MNLHCATLPLLLLLAAASPARAEEDAPSPPKPVDLAAVLEPIRAKHDLPALGGAIVTTDRLTALGVTGLRRRGGTEKVTVDDRWHLGSCTKAMTATLCAVLVEERKLSFDLTVADGLRKAAPVIDPGWKMSTLDLLLRNRGGVAGAVEPALWGSLWRAEGPGSVGRRLLVRGTLEKPPAHAPGSLNEYSNTGFTLAGAMAEEATGKSWEELITERLFKPLGMDSAGFGAPGSPSSEKADQPWGHDPKTGKGVKPGKGADNPPAIGPAGIVHCTLADWAKFVALHLRGGEGKPVLLSAESLRRLHATPDKGDDYAMGWGTGERSWGGRVLTHAGSNTMWYCVTWLAPEKGFAVLVTTNCAGDEAARAADEAAGALIREHLKR